MTMTKADEERGGAQRLPVGEVEPHVGEPCDNEQDREPIHRRAGAADDVRNDHGGGERREGFEGVEMRAIGPRRQPFEVRHALARKPWIEQPRRETDRDVGKQRGDENAPKGERHWNPPRRQSARQ